ncbi:hypothetical protein HNY73_015789 [Argiope bruennichi]|uniref:Uncharacterized protein n=1 Tax=Argiope bruennichi TaxID=94029 RepID=A0A8T0EHV5_ARGBR|nr:hypothetical protein HNY73_015789 [Argiope bruennichi]
MVTGKGNSEDTCTWLQLRALTRVCVLVIRQGQCNVNVLRTAVKYTHRYPSHRPPSAKVIRSLDNRSQNTGSICPTASRHEVGRPHNALTVSQKDAILRRVDETSDELLQKFNVTADLKTDELWKRREDFIFYFQLQSSENKRRFRKVSEYYISENRMSCSKNVIIQCPTIPESFRKFRCAESEFSSYVSKKNVLEAVTFVYLERNTNPLPSDSNLNNSKIVDKEGLVAACKTLMDIVTCHKELSEAHLPAIFENPEGVNEAQRAAMRKSFAEFVISFFTHDAEFDSCNVTQYEIKTRYYPIIL